MTELSEIIGDIKSFGVKRIPLNTKDFTKAKEVFIYIASEMVKSRDSKKEFILNDDISDKIDFILKWTSGDDYKDINNQIGFLFKGNTGVGKTFLFEVWINFLKAKPIFYYLNGLKTRLRPVIASVYDIDGEYQDKENGGHRVIVKYSKIKCLMLDDIGVESEKSKNFGNSLNVIQAIIEKREKSNLLTFGTSNTKDMSDLYDDRVYSRMTRAFQVKGVNHEIDFRKIKP